MLFDDEGSGWTEKGVVLVAPRAEPFRGRPTCDRGRSRGVALTGEGDAVAALGELLLEGGLFEHCPELAVAGGRVAAALAALARGRTRLTINVR